jgi:asparagine N-glycosylation enzyme membrane subunit Stt3
MNSTQIYIALSIVVLAVLAVLAFFPGKSKKGNRLTPLAGLSFAFVLAGLFLGENRFVGYGLMGIGLLIAVADIYKKSKQK